MEDKSKKATKHAGRMLLYILNYSFMNDEELKEAQRELRTDSSIDAKERRERLRAIEESKILKNIKRHGYSI